MVLPKDLLIPISIKNKNYVGAIFGGSLYAATDPIYMIQLIHILGDDYVVWDKSSCVKYKRPAYTDVYVSFQFSSDEIAQIKNDESKNEIDIVKELTIVDKNEIVYTELSKTLYVAKKSFYREKRLIKSEKK